MQYIIDEARNVLVGDVIIVPTLNDTAERGIECVCKVLDITKPHPDITEFAIEMITPIANDKTIGMRHRRTVCIIR